MNGKIMNKVGCPVCGYAEITAFDEFGLTTFEICDCCGCESGYDYDGETNNEHLEKLRAHWIIDNKCKFWSKKAPKGWDPIHQLKEAGIDASLYKNI